MPFFSMIGLRFASAFDGLRTCPSSLAAVSVLASVMLYMPRKTGRFFHELERLMLTTPGMIILIVTWTVLVMGLLVFVAAFWEFL